MTASPVQTRARREAPPFLHAGLEEVVERASGENFPVALRILTASQRRHLMAIYAFARLTDEIGDAAPGDRLALLDELEAELRCALAGGGSHEVLRRTADTVRALALPVEPFLALIEANRLDQRVKRYRRYADLLAYCELSANPVGRLVLHVFGAATPQRIAWSDAVCSGLQVVEHIQDVAEDFARGRVYLPADDLARFGCSEADLAASWAGDRLRSLLRFEARRAKDLLDAGVPLVRSLRGRARLAVCGFVGGGRAALDAIRRQRYDVLSRTPQPRRLDTARRILELLVAPRPIGKSLS